MTATRTGRGATRRGARATRRGALGGVATTGSTNAAHAAARIEALLTRREPGVIGAYLNDELQQCARDLAGRCEAARALMNSARSQDTQRHAAQALEVAEALRARPFFGWMSVEEDEALRAYRVGKAHCPEQRIVSWRHDLGRLFYELLPGEDYARAGGGGEIEGVLRARATLEQGAAGQLRQARWDDEQGTLEITPGDDGVAPGVDPPPEAPATPALPVIHGLPEITALITREQYQLIAAAHDQPLIIQGKAGSGKTTVALHRLSWLTFDGGDEASAARRPTIDPSRVLIVMFNRALCAFVEGLLAPLDLGAAKLCTFHAWALEAIRSVYRGAVEPSARKLTGQAQARRLKAQLGVLEAIDRYVADQTARLEPWLSATLTRLGAADWFARFEATSGPILPRLTGLRGAARAARDAAEDPDERARLEGVYRALRHIVQRMSRYKEDLRCILTDVALLRACLPGVRRREIEALARYQDARQREGAAAGKTTGARVDFDDLALILRIMQVKHGGLPTPDGAVTHLDHLMIDEAQDFGAVQMQVLLDAARTRRGVTIVGDVNQRILPGSDFMGWEALARELGLDGAAVTHLTIGHRSSAPIARLAAAIVDDPPEAGGRPGPTPVLEVVDDAACAMARLREVLSARLTEAPDAHVCVVCSGRDDARRVHAELEARLADAGIAPRLGHGGAFTFAPGVTVTNRHQVKGLEFDTVIVLEPDARAYPDTAQGRRDLYVVTSRAQRGLRFIAHGPRSPLLAPLVTAGLLKARGAAVVFEASEDEPF